MISRDQRNADMPRHHSRDQDSADDIYAHRTYDDDDDDELDHFDLSMKDNLL